MSSPNQNSTLRSRAGWVSQSLRLADLMTASAGFFGAVGLLALTAGIVIGIVFRFIGIDNTWTFDFDLYGLAWTAFVGAVLTARQDLHVTAGISLENYAPAALSKWIKLLRFVVTIGFLCLLCYAGAIAAASSFNGHEKTIDVAQWPVWIAKISVPIGTGFWALAEFAKLVRALSRLGNETHGEAAL